MRGNTFADHNLYNMELDKILSIVGKPGLFELKAQTRGGFIAQPIGGGKKMAVNVRHNVSLLSEIAIYTYGEEVALKEVFQKIKEKEDGAKAISHKEPQGKLESYFREVMPDFDEDRVYPNDIKKIIQWYNLLVSNGVTDFVTESSEESESSSEDEDQK